MKTLFTINPKGKRIQPQDGGNLLYIIDSRNNAPNSTPPLGHDAYVCRMAREYTSGTGIV